MTLEDLASVRNKRLHRNCLAALLGVALAACASTPPEDSTDPIPAQVVSPAPDTPVNTPGAEPFDLVLVAVEPETVTATPEPPPPAVSEPAPAPPAPVEDPVLADVPAPEADPAPTAQPEPTPLPPPVQEPVELADSEPVMQAREPNEPPTEATPIEQEPLPAPPATDFGQEPGAEPEGEPLASDEPEIATEPAPGLDLEELESRLRETDAIGLFTKLEIKGQVEDLVDDFEDFHRGKSKLGVDELQERFDLLIMKLLTLLQDEDPGLSKDIAGARPALWATLVDPVEFNSVRGP